MKDPYSVLGVNKNSSMEEITKAYKALVKKFHPDQYHDNPLQEMAEDKMQEINAAYDDIKRHHSDYWDTSKYNNNSYNASPYNSSTNSYGGNSNYSNPNSSSYSGYVYNPYRNTQRDTRSNQNIRFSSGKLWSALVNILIITLVLTFVFRPSVTNTNSSDNISSASVTPEAVFINVNNLKKPLRGMTIDRNDLISNVRNTPVTNSKNTIDEHVNEYFETANWYGYSESKGGVVMMTGSPKAGKHEVLTLKFLVIYGEGTYLDQVTERVDEELIELNIKEFAAAIFNIRK